MYAGETLLRFCLDRQPLAYYVSLSACGRVEDDGQDEDEDEDEDEESETYAEDRTMVTAFVLISAKRDLIPETAQALSALEGVAEVYSVAGPFDIVAVIRVRTNEELAELVTGHLLKLKGIERSETLIAFRAFSKFDLERMFSIGME